MLISAVVTAPHGAAECVYLDALLAQSNSDVEIIVVDGSADAATTLHGGVRVIAAPGRNIQGLISEGLKAARGEWVLVTEDHCNPLPGFLAAYRKAIAAHPDVDLMSGAVENLTSNAPWARAQFLVSIGAYWPGAVPPSPGGSNANMLVRRAAVLPKELAAEGGLLNMTVPRLAAAGRHAHCAGAVMDHVLPLSRNEAMSFQFGCASGFTEVRRETLAPRTLLEQIARDSAGLLLHTLVTPWRIQMRLLPGRRVGAATLLRMMALNASFFAGVVRTDLRRLAPRRAPAPRVAAMR